MTTSCSTTSFSMELTISSRWPFGEKAMPASSVVETPRARTPVGLPAESK